MSYTAPNWNAVDFQFPSTAYTAPTNTAVNFDFVDVVFGVCSGDVHLDGEASGYHSEIFPSGDALGHIPFLGEASGGFIPLVVGVAFGEIVTGEALGSFGAAGYSAGYVRIVGEQYGARGSVGAEDGELVFRGEAFGWRGSAGAMDGVLLLDGAQNGVFKPLATSVAEGCIYFHGAAFGFVSGVGAEADSLYVRSRTNRLEVMA